MNRNAVELAKENELLRSAVRELQAGRAVDPQEALAMVAKALMEQEGALGVAQRLTSVLVARVADRGVVLAGAPQGDRVITIERDEILSLDGSGLAIEENPETGAWTLTLRPPKSSIALVGPR